jgi:hypothetical protein
MSHVEALRKRNFTVVQAFYRDPKPVTPQYPMGWKTREEKVLVMTPFVKQARPLARVYFDAKFGTPREIHCYPRNYIDDARRLISEGKVVETDA